MDRCSALVADQGGFHFHPCRVKPKAYRDGKWYCLKHDPVTKAAKAKERQARFDAEHAQRLRDYACLAACHSLNPDKIKDAISALEAISRDAWSGDATRMSLIAKTADAALDVVRKK